MNSTTALKYQENQSLPHAASVFPPNTSKHDGGAWYGCDQPRQRKPRSRSSITDHREIEVNRMIITSAPGKKSSEIVMRPARGGWGWESSPDETCAEADPSDDPAKAAEKNHSATRAFCRKGHKLQRPPQRESMADDSRVCG